VVIWNIVHTPHWYILCSLDIFLAPWQIFGHLVYFVPFWYVAPRKIWQPWFTIEANLRSSLVCFPGDELSRLKSVSNFNFQLFWPNFKVTQENSQMLLFLSPAQPPRHPLSVFRKFNLDEKLLKSSISQNDCRNHKTFYSWLRRKGNFWKNGFSMILYRRGLHFN
jgi:hypothetical protein